MLYLDLQLVRSLPSFENGAYICGRIGQLEKYFTVALFHELDEFVVIRLVVVIFHLFTVLVADPASQLALLYVANEILTKCSKYGVPEFKDVLKPFVAEAVGHLRCHFHPVYVHNYVDLVI